MKRRYLFVFLDVDALELAESDEVGTDEDAQLLSLLLSLLTVTTVALVLHSHPQLIHLGEVQQDKVDGVVDVAGHLLPAANKQADTIHSYTQEPCACRAATGK